MRRRAVVGLAGACALAAGLATWSLAAAPKQYQFTGKVVDVDAKSKLVRIDKDGDVWEFSYEGLKEMSARKDDRVTVFYSMVARKIERK